MPKRPNRYLQALTESGNLAGVAAVAATAAVAASPVVLLAGLAAEAAYLIFVPESRWYQARLSGRDDAAKQMARARAKQEAYAAIDDDARRRYARLEAVRSQIDTYAQRDQDLFTEVLQKLDYLMEQFLRFAAKEKEFRQYVQGVWQEECRPPDARVRPPSPNPGFSQPYAGQQPPYVGQRPAYVGQPPPAAPVPKEQVGRMVTAIQASYDAQVKTLEAEVAEQDDESTKAVKQKRMEVLGQRRESVEKIGRIAANLASQLDLVEDTFGLINDQIRARSPEQLLSDVESAVLQTDSMTSLLEELAPLDRATA